MAIPGCRGGTSGTPAPEGRANLRGTMSSFGPPSSAPAAARAHVVGLTPKHRTLRRRARSWGVVPVRTEAVATVHEVVDKACAIASHRQIAMAGDVSVIAAGVPFGAPGATNLLRRAVVPA